MADDREIALIEVTASPAREQPHLAVMRIVCEDGTSRDFDAIQCVLGKNGVVADKHEGDGGTPIGKWPLREVLYRADRMARPKTSLPVRAIQRSWGWCDDPSSDSYNKLIDPSSDFDLAQVGHERLWREDHLYDVFVVLGYNDSPVQKGLGSAIFMHIAPNKGGGTQGCVGLDRAILLDIIAVATPRTLVQIIGDSESAAIE